MENSRKILENFKKLFLFFYYFWRKFLLTCWEANTNIHFSHLSIKIEPGTAPVTIVQFFKLKILNALRFSLCKNKTFPSKLEIEKSSSVNLTEGPEASSVVVIGLNFGYLWRGVSRGYVGVVDGGVCSISFFVTVGFFLKPNFFLGIRTSFADANCWSKSSIFYVEFRYN